MTQPVRLMARRHPPSFLAADAFRVRSSMRAQAAAETWSAPSGQRPSRHARADGARCAAPSRVPDRLPTSALFLIVAAQMGVASMPVPRKARRGRGPLVIFRPFLLKNRLLSTI